MQRLNHPPRPYQSVGLTLSRENVLVLTTPSVASTKLSPAGMLCGMILRIELGASL